MSLEKAERYLEELDAIKYYDQVKAERDKLLIEVQQLEQGNWARDRARELLSEEIEALRTSIEDERASKEKLEGEIKSRDRELEGIRSEVVKLEDENSALRETGKLIEEERLTLPQLRERVARVKADEIKAEAERIFDEHKSRWEKEEKPKEVGTEAQRVLRDFIGILKGPEPHHFAQNIVELGLPDMVNGIVSSEVKHRLDGEFYRRVEQESERKALEKLDQLKRVEWPKWYHVNVEPKIAQLEALIRANVLDVLESIWTITCDKCRQSFNMNLTSEHIAVLLRSEYIEVECQNVNCTDSVLWWSWRHKVRISSRDLIMSRISLSPRSRGQGLLMNEEE